MSAEERVRQILVNAAKDLEQDWQAAYRGERPRDWEVEARRKLDQAVESARRLIAENTEVLGKTAGLFEKTRISKLYEELENAAHRVTAARARRFTPIESERGQEEADLTLRELRRELAVRRMEIKPRACTLEELEQASSAFVSWAAERCEAATRTIQGLSLANEVHYKELIGDVKRSAEHSTRQTLEDKRQGWYEPATYEKITAQDLEGLARPRRPFAKNGLYYSCFWNGQVKQVRRLIDGEVSGTLTLARGKASGHYEDSANVAHFHADGLLEEYGGRYERNGLARKTFKTWVLETITSMA